MRNVPNDVVATLCRYLPQILENLDAGAISKSLRLKKTVR